jgi:hypothetical protein
MEPKDIAHRTELLKGEVEGKVAFNKCPRYNSHKLSTTQLDAIAELAATKALAMWKDEIAREVGESTIAFGKDALRKLLWLIGAMALAALSLGSANLHLPKF